MNLRSTYTLSLAVKEVVGRDPAAAVDGGGDAPIDAAFKTILIQNIAVCRKSFFQNAPLLCFMVFYNYSTESIVRKALYEKINQMYNL